MDDGIRTRLEELLTVRSIDMKAASVSAGLGETYVRDVIQRGRGKVDLVERVVRAIDPSAIDFVLRGNGPKPTVTAPTANGGYRAPPDLLGPRDFPIFASVEGGSGAQVVTNDVIEMVQRPWYMRDVAGYGVLVTGDSMDPAFRPGDIAVVNPKLPPIRGKNAIFVAGEDRGEFRASIKEYQREDAKAWHVLQHNPPEGAEKHFTLDKREWTKALRVVGKYEGG